MMNCPKCGSQNEDDAKLCYRCYAPLKRSQGNGIISSSAKDTTRQAKQRRGRPLLYISVIVILGIIGGFILARTSIHKASQKVKVYEGTQEVSETEGSKQSFEEISALFKQMDEILKKGEMIEFFKLYRKEFRERFDSWPLQERIMFLNMSRIGAAGFTECKTKIVGITFQDSEKTEAKVVTLAKAKVVTLAKCRNPSTGETREDECTWPLVKEEGGWKVDEVAFMKEFDERLKAK